MLTVAGMASPQVVVVGSYVQDLCWKCERFPQAGQTIVGQFATGPGGKGSNQAVASGRTGVPTLFVGAVGKDAFAKEAKAFYKAEGIGATFVEKAQHATGTAAILVEDSGQNEIVVALGANAALLKTDVPAKALTQAKVAVVQLESNLTTAAHVLKTARRAGVTTVLNPAPMRPDFDPSMLASVDVLIPNETEFTALVNRLRIAGRTDFTEAALHALAPAALHALCRTLGPGTVIVTLGKKGCFVSQKSGHASIAAYTGIRVVDTTGAGDAFVGGFAAGLVKFEGDVLAAARFANAVAALSVTKMGTAPSMPTKAEIAGFLRKRGG
ncbi:ribokinase [Nibricoccus aquaticus]|uniref:Ribokinase n=2 Tax=Nibricoccus aquaticus TaxID=2576891 RepID=A0A290Q485_9BACT|nr:ribokinase [Nibricoccus aquaticus]